MLEKVFKDSRLAVCIKDVQKNVIYQNEASLEVCGSQDGVCQKNCMLCYTENMLTPQKNEGTQCFKNQNFEGQYYDVFFIHDGKYITTLLYPLSGRYKADLKYFDSFKLTKKEKEVVLFIIKGLTNLEISQEMKISIATLKTHLNNLYKKIPVKVTSGWRRTRARRG